MSEVGTIKVKYECVDGMHFFTSGDAMTKGLCAASKDLRVAFDGVSYQCEQLLIHNHKMDVSVTPSLTFAEFQAWLEGAVKPNTETFRPIPQAELAWQKLAA